jgi:hypothetical protein
MEHEGVPMIAGTDAPYPGDFQGEGIHHELELLVESGLTPIDAISSATRNASPFMKASNDWGTLESGRPADLLVINGRPDQNIQGSGNPKVDGKCRLPSDSPKCGDGGQGGSHFGPGAAKVQSSVRSRFSHLVASECCPQSNVSAPKPPKRRSGSVRMPMLK